MTANLYRNESLVQLEEYQVEGTRAEELIGRVRAKWALLRELGYAGDYPVDILRSARENGSSNVTVTELFRWKTRQASLEAKASPAYQSVVKEIGEIAGRCAAS